MLALPLMLNSSLQAIISLTDTWFVGHISTSAIAAMGAVYWVVLLVPGADRRRGPRRADLRRAGGGQPAPLARLARHVDRALGGVRSACRFTRRSPGRAAPSSAPFGLDPEVEQQAIAFWQPRMLGAPLGIAAWALLGFFNGISRPRISVMTTGLVALVNAALNWLFIFELGWGIAGSAWATNASMLCGVLFALGQFLRPELRLAYRTHLTWRPDVRNLLREFRLGLPMGAMAAADLFGLSLFQLMQVRLSQVEGAASQIIMMLTSIAYMPGIGIALASTTLVGQSIGAGDRGWARTLGNRMIVLNTAFMGTIGVLLAAAGPWILPSFVNAADPSSAEIVRLSAWLLWIAAAYQAFDGLNLGSAFSLRGAGDARLPALVFLVLSWGVFVPLAHMLSFAPGQGWVDVLPQFGLGATGGWIAMVVYVVLLGSALFLRWRSARGSGSASDAPFAGLLR